MLKKLLQNVLLVLVSVTLSVALIEFGLRIIEARDEISYEMLMRSDTVDLRALNYNNDTVQRRKANAGDLRVLSFGDSFAYTIVRGEFTYHTIAAKVASAASGRRVELVNLGEPAVSFYQYMNAYQSFGRAIDHDAVVFNIYLGNDILDVAYRYVPDDAKVNRLFGDLELDVETGEARNVTIPHRYPARILDYGRALYLSFGRRMKSVPSQARPGQYNFAVAELAEDAWLDNVNTQFDNFDPGKLAALRDGYVAAIQFARYTRRILDSGKHVLILLSPNQSQVDEAVLERAAAHFRRDRRRLDIDLSARLLARIFSDIAPAASVVYLRPALVCASRNGLSTYYKRDTHWSADGNRIVGEAVGGWIATHWLGAAAPFVDDACAFPTPAPVASDAEPHFSSLIRPLLTAASPLGRMQP